MRVFFYIIQTVRRRIPNMQVAIPGRVFSLITKQQLPIALNAPKILERTIGFSHGHIVDGVANTVNGLARAHRFVIKQVDTC